MEIANVKQHRDLYIVSLQILALAGGERLQSRQILMQNLLAHANLDKNSAKFVISILLRGDLADKEDQNRLGRSEFPFHQTGSDADVESEDVAHSVYAPSMRLLSTEAFPKVLELLKDLGDHNGIADYALCQIHRILVYAKDKRLPKLRIGHAILKLLQSENVTSDSMVQTGIEICKVCLNRGEPVTRDYLHSFIDLINGSQKREAVMLGSMHLLNAMIRTQWCASMQPLSYLRFPVISDHPRADAFQSPWCQFQWPPSNLNGKFALVAWLRIEGTGLVRPIHIFGMGNDGVTVDIVLQNRSMLVSVSKTEEKWSPGGEGESAIPPSCLGTAKFEDIFPSASWCQLAINFVFVMESDVLQLEVYRDGECLNREGISLKSANLTLDSIKDFPRRFQVGTMSPKEANTVPTCCDYAQSWLFSRKLSHVELLWLYLLGPSNTSLQDVKHARLLPRAALIKKVLIRDPRLATVIKLGDQDSPPPIKELEQLRHAVLAFHSAAKLPNRLVVYQYPGQHHRRSLLSSLFNLSPALTDPSRLVVESLNSPFPVAPKDLFKGSWCHALQSSGGLSLLLLVLAKVAETGSDEAISLAVDALVRFELTFFDYLHF